MNTERKKVLGLLQRWREDPVAFVREALNAEPEPWQAEALMALVTNDRVAVKAGHGVGKSTTFAWAILWFLLTHYPSKIPCTSPSAHQLFDVLWAEIQLWHRQLDPSLQAQIVIQNDRVELAGAPLECFASARTARKEKPDALQGFHSKNLLFLIDEASGVEDVIFEVASGAMSTAGAKMMMVGNPLRAMGYFYRAFMPGSGFKTMTVSSENVPRARGVADEIARNYGRDSNIYRVRVMGEFPTAGDDVMIPLELVEAATNRELEVPMTGGIWGLDVARFGDDTSCLVKRWPRGVTDPPIVWNNLNTMEVAGRVKKEYDNTPDRFKPEKIYVDAIGIGAGVADRLFEMNLPAVAVNVAENPALLEDTCFRMRDELWVNALRWLEGRECKLPKHERLANELCSLRKSYASNGKLKVESKDEMRKRGLRSPDVADAFVLTFAYQNVYAGKAIEGQKGVSDWKKPISREAVYV